VALLVILPAVVYAESVQVASAEIGVSKMNFHMYSLVYSNSNSSIFIYNGADSKPPTYATPVTSVVSCKVRQSAQIWFGQTDVWLGGVSWITQPLTEDMVIQGKVSVTVWMSAADQEAAATGYAFGLSEADGLGNPIGDPFYEYYYGYGSVLGSSPTAFNLSFNVTRTFTKGNIVSFFVVVGSTTEGWQYQVYFDSASTNSFADVPILGVPVPEFSQARAVIMMALVVLSWYAVARRKSWSSLDSAMLWNKALLQYAGGLSLAKGMGPLKP